MQVLTEKQAETDRQMKETFKEINKMMGEWGNNFGQITEEYFFNSFEKGQKNFFGKKFDEIDRNIKGRLKEQKGEYDIVLYNADSIKTG